MRTICDMKKGSKITWTRRKQRRVCVACAGPFLAIRHDPLTCSNRCRKWLSRFRQRNSREPMFAMFPHERPKFHVDFAPIRGRVLTMSPKPRHTKSRAEPQRKRKVQ